jgi:glutamate N-acetyltransferase / amino-acid N-acetyltransferase
MIHPNMGTTLCFPTTDCMISHDVRQRLLAAAVERSFNRITADGDTSTNDTCLMLANGLRRRPV